MKCEYCGNTITDGAKFCSSCGAPAQVKKYGETSEAELSDRKWSDFIVKSIFLGPSGLAWFYIGRKRIGAVSALIGILSFAFAVGFTIYAISEYNRSENEAMNTVRVWRRIALKNIAAYKEFIARNANGHSTYEKGKLKETERFLAELESGNYHTDPPFVSFSIYDRKPAPGEPDIETWSWHDVKYKYLRINWKWYDLFGSAYFLTGWSVFFGIWLAQSVGAFFIKKDAEGKILR